MSYLVGKYGDESLARLEAAYDAVDDVLVARLWDVSLERNIAELCLWSDVDRNIAALAEYRQS